MRKVVNLSIVLVWSFLAPAIAYAQAQGSLTGVVKDTSGAVLPGVTVEASSPVLIEKTRTAVTDGTGQYRFVNLYPGTYTVTFTLQGFNTVIREGLEVSGAFVATVNVEMRVGTISETVIVTGETPIVDLQSTTRQRVLSPEVIDGLPSARIPYDLAVLTPGVTMRNGAGTAAVQDVGGTAGNQQANSLVVHGSKPVDMRLTYNGLTLATLETGKNAGAVNNPTSLQEVTVDSSAVSAELATGGVRLNLIPRDGGNTFKGMFFGSFANGSMQGSNYTQALQDAGLRTPGSIKKIFDVNPGFGGPLKRDKLWFYVSWRHNAWQNYITGISPNANAGNPNAWTYVADPTESVYSDNFWLDLQTRFTWQATPRNRFAATYNPQYGHTSSGGSATASPETATKGIYDPKVNVFVDWTAPVTNRLLFEVVGVRMVERLPGSLEPRTSTLIGVLEQNGGLTYRGVTAPSGNLWNEVLYYRASVTYVTGAHTLKVGFNNAYGQRTTSPGLYPGQQPISFRFNNGVPNQITQLAVPYTAHTKLDADGGIYTQDRWTMDRLTISAGVRFDYYKSSFPAQTVGPAILAPTRNFTLPPSDGVRGWKDITPKFGIAYDLFGTGKTAIKGSVNKYLQGQALGGDLPDRPFGYPLNPVYQLVSRATRSWTDNGNFVPDCDLTNPSRQDNRAGGGDLCGQLSNTNFGTIAPSATYDPAVLGGWGSRAYNWEFSASVQHEVVPRVSVDVGYFWRIFGNILMTDNLAVAASEYDRFSFTAPVDPRLPGGGGYTVSAYDLNPTKFGVPANDLRTFSDNYGEQIDRWQGVDVSVTARRAGALVQGGLSSGRTTQDNCAIVAQVPESRLGILGNAATVWTPAEYCHYQTPFLTQYKLLGTYSLPKWDVRVSSTFQSVPGPEVIANYNVPTAVAALSLGRPLSGGAANTTVNLIAPGTVFGDRHNQLDFRATKILNFGRTRTTVNVDLYNALNANPVVSENPNYTAFRRPTAILPARFVKFSLQTDF